jgi:hypothetical protein
MISELNLEAIIEHVWRCTGRTYSSAFGDSLAGHDRASVEMHLEVVDLEAVYRETGEDGS